MAKANPNMRAHVAGSMNDRPAPEGSSGEARPAGIRPPAARQADGRRRLEAASLIRLDRIIPDPDQPRAEFDPESLELLAASLEARGQLQPIRVRWDDAADRYMVIVGERRFRAAMMAGLEAVACVVADGSASAEDILEDQLVENALRADLKPVEQARAYRTLMKARGLTQAQLAGRLQVTQGAISKALALLDLPAPIRAEVEAGAIAPNTAYELSKVTDPGEQAELAREAAGGRLRRDEIRSRTRTPRKAAATPGRRAFRTVAGDVVTFETARELEPGAIAAALLEVLDLVRAESGEAAP